MIILPHGCRVSDFSVHPKNWKAKDASTKENWYCRYRFYDASGKIFQGYLAGVNHLKTAKERRQLLSSLIEQEKEMLLAGYNPLTKHFQADHGDEYSTWKEALQVARKSLQLARTTAQDLDFCLGKICAAATSLGYGHLTVGEIEARHIKKILQESSGSAYRYNKHRSYLMMLYVEMVEQGMAKTNLLRDIRKQKTTKKIRETLTMDQRRQVNEYLQENHPAFWRLMHIFFHSGARTTELLQVRRIDVDLAGQRYKAMVRKGTVNREVWRTIKDIALPLWQEACSGADSGDYLFSKGLKPGPAPIRYDQIGKRWKRLVKDRLGITADWYSLRHSNTTEVVEELDDQAAAALNAHRSTAMVVGIYDVRRSDRDHERLKKVRNKFA